MVWSLSLPLQILVRMSLQFLQSLPEQASSEPLVAAISWAGLWVVFLQWLLLSSELL